MPKLKNPSVKFAFIKKKRFPFQTVRLCLTYKGKRLYQTDESNRWYGIDLSQFNSDGTLRPNFTVPDKEPDPEAARKCYIQESEGLVNTARIAIIVADEAIKRNVWEAMTSKDFSKLLDMVALRNAELLWAERGQVTKGNTPENYAKWGTYPKRIYEWYWQQVGKGVL